MRALTRSRSWRKPDENAAQLAGGGVSLLDQRLKGRGQVVEGRLVEHARGDQDVAGGWHTHSHEIAW
ncbi:MAG: hypothetical protein ACYSUA_16730 [Planctomycetota bacterium]|jgi:hypothetical protein